MTGTDERRPARALVLTTVAVAVLGIGILSAVATVPASPAAAPHAGVSSISVAAAHTSSAFCAAPTGPTAGTTDYLTNTGAAAVPTTMTTVEDGGGQPATQTFAVPAGATLAVNPELGLPPGSHATAFTFGGGGVAVSQAVWGSFGWGMAPCATTVSDQWLFPSGSTAGGDNLDVALFNPTASAAMVDISFLTPGGPLTPQPYQGVVVGPGQLVDEGLGAYAQDLPQVATVVSVVSGALVADELAQWPTAPPTGLSLQLGATGPSTEWRFGATTTTSGGTVGFDVANPSPNPVSVTFSATLPSATVVPRTVTVPASSTATFTPSSTPGWPQQAPYAVAVRATGPVVVGRSVAAASGASGAGRGLTLGVPGAAVRWLVPGPGISTAPATAGGTAIRSISVVDPGSAAVPVTISPVGRPGVLARFVVAPGQLATLARSQLAGSVPFVVSASAPVVVEEDDGPTGAPGVVAWSGLPFAG